MEKTEYVSLGRKIALYRQKRGLSQRLFAKKIGISPSYLGKLECGRGISGASLEVLETIAHGLGFSAGELLTLTHQDYALARSYINARQDRVEKRLHDRPFHFCNI